MSKVAALKGTPVRFSSSYKVLSYLGAVVPETALRSWQDPLGMVVCCGKPLSSEYDTYKAVKATF